MMKTKKNIFLFLIALLLSGGFITSCYDDSSTLDINDIGVVEIDTTGISELSVYQFEHLMVSPQINLTHVSESDLTYTWRINLEPNDTTFFVISTEKNLDYLVELRPNEADYYYTLTLTITNMAKGLDYFMAWETTVRNPLGEGLVVAETDDNTNTDLSLIMSPKLTEGYSGEKILRHVYSINNGGLLMEGKVKQMRFTVQYGKNIIQAITDNSIFKVETYDYSYAGMNDDLFFASKESYSPQLLGYINQGDLYIGNHQLTGTYLGITRKFGLPLDFTFEVPDHVAMNPSSSATVAVNFYDESLGGFVYLPSIQSFADHDMHAYASVSGADFDPSLVPGKTNLAAATNVDGDFLHLLKDNNSGDVALYILDGGGYEYPNTIAPAPKAFFDLSDAPEIENATQFVFLNDQKVMFYATSTKVYAVLYGTSTPTYEERYTVPSGEEITTLQLYLQAGYPNRDPYLTSHNRQLVMSTYSTEGKVYLLPFKNLGAANIDTENVKTFDGFGRITAITPQQ